MINDNNIEDWYKDELSNFEVNPINNGWENISKKLNEAEQPININEENIESWYKTEINKYEAEPTQEVWNKLSTKLDLENVWTRVLSSLNKYERMIWWRNFGLRTAAIVVLLYGSYLTYNSIQSSVDSSQSSVHNSQSTVNNSPPKTFGTVSSSQPSVDDSQFSVGSSQSSNRKSQIVNQKSKIINSKSQIVETPLYASLTVDKFSPKKAGILDVENQKSTIYNAEQQGANLEIKTLELKEFLVKKEKNKIIFNDKRFSSHFVFGMYARRFYVGVNAGLKKQNLLTKVNSNHQISTAKQQQFLDFGYNFGGTIGIIMSDKLNLESNVNFISTSGYNRKYEANDLSYTENLNLNYTTISVLAKKMSNKSTFDNKKYSTNLIGGIYGGYLTSAEILSNNTSYDAKNEFNSLDLGIVLGIEQDRYLTKELVITPGIRYQQGLINISNIASDFESAHTFTLEFNVGIKYIFLKKN